MIFTVYMRRRILGCSAHATYIPWEAKILIKLSSYHHPASYRLFIDANLSFDFFTYCCIKHWRSHGRYIKWQYLDRGIQWTINDREKKKKKKKKKFLWLIWPTCIVKRCMIILFVYWQIVVGMINLVEGGRCFELVQLLRLLDSVG